MGIEQLNFEGEKKDENIVLHEKMVAVHLATSD